MLKQRVNVDSSSFYESDIRAIAASVFHLHARVWTLTSVIVTRNAMTKAAVIILAGTGGRADLDRLANGLETAKEFVASGDKVDLIFDGAETSGFPNSKTKTATNTSSVRQCETTRRYVATVRSESTTRSTTAAR